MFFEEDQKVIGVVASNSAGYIKKVFKEIENGNVVVTLRSEKDQERISLASVEEVFSVDESSGWVHGLKYPESESTPESIAQVLFSSGTEGIPKAILLSHGALSNTTDRLISVMQITPEIKEYIGVPVFYSFGFGRCRVVSKAGGSFYLPPGGFDPLEISSMLEAGAINALSAVPSLWRVLLQMPELFEKSGTNMRWIEIGSQYMSQAEKEQLKQLFPRARIVQHYGLTEASRSTFLNIDEATGAQLESVGSALLGVEISIGEKGQIKIRGPHLASGLIKEGVCDHLVDSDGWFTTSDTGYIEEGLLYYSGRSDDIINCGGVKLSPDLIEQDLNRELGIGKGIAVSKAADDLRGDVPLVCYLKSLDLGETQLKEALAKTSSNGGLPLDTFSKFFACEDLPTTDTGKVQRKQLTQLHDASEKNDVPRKLKSEEPQTDDSELAQRLVAIWEDVLNISPISVNDSFFDLGGDSLSVIRVTMKMEKSGIPKEICRKIFDGHSISQIAAASMSDEEAEQTLGAANNDFQIGNVKEGKALASSEKTPIAAASQSINILRGLLVLLNVAAHWMLAVVERMPAGFAEINMYFAVFYSSGTPGFAIVFGVGVGFFFLPRFIKDPSSVALVLRRNILLLGAGITCLAIVKVAAQWVTSGAISGMSISNSFWSVLTFYFYAVLTLFLWLKILTRTNSFGLSCLTMALACYSLHLWLDSLAIPPSENPLLQHFVLLLTAKYNYLEMSSGMLLGAAAGNWIRLAVQERRSLNGIALVGALLVAVSVILSFEMGDSRLWTRWPKGLYLWTWPLYLGCVLMGIAFVQTYITTRNLRGPLDVGVKLISIIGILAFPFFIAHEIVAPFRDLLAGLGVPMALPISLALFFIGMGYLVGRLYRFYYGKGSSKLLTESS